MKFKIGDIVIGNKKANRYNFTTEGWIGEVVKVLPNSFTGNSTTHGRWAGLDYDCFDLYDPSDISTNSDKIVDIFLNSK